jgi:hypothetical protein
LWPDVTLCTFISGLFYDTVNISDFIASNDAVISISLIGEDVQGNGGDQVCGTVPEISWKD